MKYSLLFGALILLFSCKEQTNQPEATQTVAKEAGWTKPMIYASDAPTTYFDDVDDQDFSDYSKLIYQVFEEVYAGRLQAYNFIDGSKISIDEIKKIVNRVDTMYVENPQTNLLEMKIVEQMIDKSIISVKVKETWRFNKETLQLEKKVLGIAPRLEVYNEETGEIKGYTPIFWVFFDKEAEKAFAQQKPL